ncbi:MAG: hypothetical protein AVDCRST_MAG93-3441, partial [uncultured Chloroflexia bacterium]
VVEKFALNDFQYRARQNCGTWVEVINIWHSNAP